LVLLKIINNSKLLIDLVEMKRNKKIICDVLGYYLTENNLEKDQFVSENKNLNLIFDVTS
jgi:hypothetical protein